MKKEKESERARDEALPASTMARLTRVKIQINSASFLQAPLFSSCLCPHVTWRPFIQIGISRERGGLGCGWGVLCKAVYFCLSRKKLKMKTGGCNTLRDHRGEVEVEWDRRGREREEVKKT